MAIETVILYPSADYGGYSDNQIYVSDTEIRTGTMASNSTTIGVVEFDLPDLTNATVTKLEFGIRMTSISSGADPYVGIITAWGDAAKYYQPTIVGETMMERIWTRQMVDLTEHFDPATFKAFSVRSSRYGMRFNSSEIATESYRPMLQMTYEVEAPEVKSFRGWGLPL